MDRQMANKHLAVCCSVCMGILLPGESANATTDQEVVTNNEGVKALNVGNFPLAVGCFQKCLDTDPHNRLARENLAFCFSKWGKEFHHQPKEAISKFQKALYYNSNYLNEANLNEAIKVLGKDPNSFEDRVELAKAAELAGDKEGYVVELLEALKIKLDPSICVELGASLVKMGGKDTSCLNLGIEQLIRVVDSPSASLETKIRAWRLLGQAYKDTNDSSNSANAYNTAIALEQSDKQKATDSIQKVWQVPVEAKCISKKDLALAYERELSSDPNNLQLLERAGNLYLKIGDGQRSLDLFVRLLNLRPDYEPAIKGKQNALKILSEPRKLLPGES